MRKLTILFALLCASMMSWATIDWDAVDYLGSTDPSISGNTYKYALDSDDAEAGPDGIANIQPAAETGILGLYTHYGPLNVVSCSHNGKISGTQLWVYVDQLTEKDTKITVTLSDASTRAFHLYNKNGGAVDPNVPHASGKGFGTYIAKNVPFYTRVDNKADETQTPMGTADLYIVTYGNKMMAKAKLNGGTTFQGNGYSMQFRIWNDAQTGFGEYWAQLRAESNTVALIDMNSNYCNLNQGTRTELSFNTYMETTAGTGAVPMFMYTLDYINAPIVGDETAPVISSVAATYNPITAEPQITITATDANDMFYKLVAPDNSISYSFSNVFDITSDGSNDIVTYHCYAIDYNGNISEVADVNVQMKPALSNIALNKVVTTGHNQANAGQVVDGNWGEPRWASGSGEHWFYINFVNVYDLSAVRIKWETARPNNYTFRTSIDGANWTDVETYTEYPAANVIVDYILPANTQGRYFGVWATSGYENLNWGISPYEVEVYGSEAELDDHNPPTMVSADLSGDPEWNQVRIAVSGSDDEDGSVVSFRVVDATNSIDQICVASAGVITVTGLSGETEYHFEVYAKDNAGNESTSAITVNATTPIDTTVPLVAAPAPDATGKDVLPIYSDAFASILAHPFDKDGWGGVPLMEEKNISGDNCLIYNVASANEVIWGMYDNGNNAIIAADGYHSADGKGVDASAMTHLHIDMWSLQPCTNAINICINDAALKTLRLSHDGTGWNSYDIALSEFAEGDAGKQKDNVRWFKFNGIGPISGKMALDNVYFWAPASGMKSVSASSNNATMGSAVVKQGDDEVTSVAENSEVSFIATANPGYVFVNWTNLGVEVSTEATYVATITETTNLVANFDYVRTNYCRTEVLTNNGKKLYLSVSKVADNTYKIRIDGSAEARINGRNNFNFVVNHTTNYSNEVYDEITGLGWKVSNEGNGYIENTFSAPDYKALTFGNHYFAIGAQGGGEFVLDNNFPAVNSIAWNSTCSDTEAPVFDKAEAEVLNETSVQLKIQATDNWGGLLTYTIAYAGAEPIISNHASGEEFTQDVTGLTTNTEYDFTITVSDGVNNTETHIVVTPIADNEKPEMTSASLDSKTWNSAIINVAATDNKGVTAYYIAELDAEYVAAEGKITVESLTAATAYTFTITAKDAAGNESANNAVVAFTTDAHLLAPTTAAPVPTWPAAQVKSIYSDSYSLAPSAIPNYDDCWWDCPNANEGDVEGNNYMLYNLYRNGMIGVSFADISVATMEKIHIDIWASATGSLTFRPITTGGPNNPKTLNLLGQQWNSFDIEMSEFDGHNWADLYQYTFENYQAGGLVGEYIAVDNVYFYRETALADDEVPTNAAANLTETGFYSVKITASAEDNSGAVNFSVMNGAVEVATGSAATATATTITINGLTPGTAYSLNVIAKDDAGNEAAPVAVAANTLAAPNAAPVPTVPATAVKSLYSNAYTTAVPVAINYREWWWESPNVQGKTLGAGDDVLFYDNNHQAGGSFGWAWSGENKVDFSGFQKLHLHIYPAKSGTIEIYPVIAPEGEFHKVSQTLTAGQWNEIILDYTDKTFAPLNQVGFVNFYALGEFFVDNVYFFKAPDYTRDDDWMAPGELGTVCYPEGLVVTGATMYKMAGTDANGKFVFDEVDVLEPGVPYLFEAHANALHFYATAETPATEAGTSNGMVGTFADKVIPQNSPNIYYFSGTKFYAVTARSTDLDVPANRAYVDLTTPHPAGAPRAGVRRVVFDVQGSNAATGFGEVQGDELQSTKVLIDGHLFIRRGEKTYDATGRMVK